MRIAGFLLLVFALLRTGFAFAQMGDIKFKHLTTNQGLSQSNVTAILQDSQGLIGFGTQDGLNKYNAYSFTVYRYKGNNPHSLSHSYI